MFARAKTENLTHVTELETFSKLLTYLCKSIATTYKRQVSHIDRRGGPITASIKCFPTVALSFYIADCLIEMSQDPGTSTSAGSAGQPGQRSDPSDTGRHWWTRHRDVQFDGRASRRCPPARRDRSERAVGASPERGDRRCVIPCSRRFGTSPRTRDRVIGDCRSLGPEAAKSGFGYAAGPARSYIATLSPRTQTAGPHGATMQEGVKG